MKNCVEKNKKILLEIVNVTFSVHDGKSWVGIKVNNSIVGKKFGEFVFTRKKKVEKKK